MRFPNAQAGVQKLYTGQILSLIAVACTILAGIGIATLSLVLISIFGIAAGVLSIIAFIFMLIGLSKAQRDDGYFKTAFYAAIAGIILSIIATIFNSSAVANGIFSFLSQIASLAITIFVIRGIQNIAEQLGDSALAEKAKSLFKLYIIVYGVGIIIGLIGSLLQASLTAAAIAAILSIIAAIIQIVAFIMYIRLLGNAKESFKG